MNTGTKQQKLRQKKKIINANEPQEPDTRELSEVTAVFLEGFNFYSLCCWHEQQLELVVFEVLDQAGIY